MKRLVAFLAIFLMLPSITACKQTYPVIEDTNVNGRKWGNVLAAEQSDWIAMRSEKGDKAGILLFNKTEERGQFLVEGNYRDIGLLNNQVFYRTSDEVGALYCFDLALGEQRLLVESAFLYQVRGEKVYYTTTDDDQLHTYHLETGAQGVVELSYKPDAFWWTDYGLYYFNDERMLLMVLPNDAKMDRVVLQTRGFVRDVIATEGARIAFVQVVSNGNGVVCTYNPADKKMKEHFEGKFVHFNYIRDRAVVFQGSNICSIDLQTDQVYSWGELKNAENVQLLSDCAVFYTDGSPAIQYYPESK